MAHLYHIAFSKTPPVLGRFDADPAWRLAQAAELSFAHPASSDHRPRTVARMLYDAASLYVLFTVEDRYVRSVQREFNSPVCTDSCVEAFLQPTPAGYFNFEFNAGGTLLCSYIRDHRRTADGFVDYTLLPAERLRCIEIEHSLPMVVEPELAEPTPWQLAARIPLDLLEGYCGHLAPAAGQTWRGNFFKCAGNTSHPHWLSWNPIGEELNFHLPEHFAEMRLR